MTVSTGRHYWLAIALVAASPAIGQLAQPGVAPARGPDAPKPSATPTDAASPGDGQQATTPIVPEPEFDAAMPALSGDLNAPLEPMPSAPAVTPPPAAGSTAAGSTGAVEALPPAGAEDPQLAQPLVPLAGFDSVPLATAADVEDKDAPAVRYETAVKGLDDLHLTAPFKSLSALQEGGGKAANATQVAARAKEDEALAVRLMKSLGYYDGTALSLIETIPGNPRSFARR